MCRLGAGWAAVRGRSGRCRNTLFTNFPDAAAAGSARSLDGVGLMTERRHRRHRRRCWLLWDILRLGASFAVVVKHGGQHI